MKARSVPTLDPRTAHEIYEALLARLPAYVPDWVPAADQAENALFRVFSRYVEAILQRLNQAPEKNRLAFYDMLNIGLIPAQAARVPLVFKLGEDAAPVHVAAGTQVSAPPSPESRDQIVFETEQGIGITPGHLAQVVSLWPGRDQVIDHTEALTAGTPLRPFAVRELKDTPHHIYIAHNTLLALAGEARINLTFELTETSNQHLDIAWEYWDGKVWRGFQAADPRCEGETELTLDSTQGLQRSGRFVLLSDCAESEKLTINGIEAHWIRGRLTTPLPPDPAQVLPLVEGIQLSTEIKRPLLALVTEEVDGLAPKPFLVAISDPAIAQATSEPLGLEPDAAYADAEQLDTSKSFFPLGQLPQPGSTFYFHNEEIAGKPGAEVTVYVEKAETAYDNLGVPPSTSTFRPDVRWEYWNGHRWATLLSGSGAAAFEQDGIFTFTVPRDLRPVEVNGEEAAWMRARLHSGGYGFHDTISVTSGAGGDFGFFVNQPPALTAFRLGYAWQYGPFPADHVITYNDFRHEDHTYAARWPGTTFSPFELLHDVTPALYLGFSQPLPVDRLNLYLDIVEDVGEPEGPPLLWEYWDGGGWRALSVDDETHHLRGSGMLSWIGPADSKPLDRFGVPLTWVRGRLKEDGPPGSPTLNSMWPNAVWVAQRQTLVNEPLGTSTGRPDQIFDFHQIPVLAEEQIEVRELSGARANVEWRLLALEILGGAHETIRELEGLLNREGRGAEVEKGDLRLEVDRNKRVTAVWVRWTAQPHLYLSGPDDRHYLLERSRGRVRFGDGDLGKLPPPGATIIARRYISGGGQAGNVESGKITQLLAGVGGVEEVFNPRAAEGGAEAETVAQLAERGARTLRHRGRALTPPDYETMAHEASAAVAVARALPARDGGGRERPGWITLVIIPQSAEARPWPSLGLRQHVWRYIAARAPADLVAAGGLVVTGPAYQEVDMDVVVVPRPTDPAGVVESRLRMALATFFHPLHGGPEGRGWAPGQPVYLSAVAGLIERVPGVDYVEHLALTAGGAQQGERIRIPPGHSAVAGTLRIRLVSGGTEPLAGTRR
jgi:hypothetical protein